jgi:hypothetical protein
VSRGLGGKGGLLFSKRNHRPVRKALTFLTPAVMNRQFIRLSIFFFFCFCRLSVPSCSGDEIFAKYKLSCNAFIMRAVLVLECQC